MKIVLVLLMLGIPSLLQAQEKTDLGTPPAVPEMKLVSPKHSDLITELIQQHGFERSALIALFQDAVILPEILDKFTRAPEKRLAYYEYREIFFKNDLISKGQAYMKENLSLLAQTEAQYGVPKEVVAAILGIETRFGQPGIEKYRAWDILNTAYLLHPTRTDFYKQELIAYLKLCRAEGLDPRIPKSSYAGAMGVPQFIPSSILKYAVDANGDQKKDLWSSKEDIYASVANYLKEMGWQTNRPIRLPLDGIVNRDSLKDWTDAGINKSVPPARALEMGLVLPASVTPQDLLSFVWYKPNADYERPLILFDNFRAITRYNISVNYALVVTELSEALTMVEAPLAPREPSATTHPTGTTTSPAVISPAPGTPPPASTAQPTTSP